MQHSMRLFRAQRNFYISGFAIFLTLVIRRLITLISTQALLLAQSEASLRQAQSATTAARSLLSQQKDREVAGESSSGSGSGEDDTNKKSKNADNEKVVINNSFLLIINIILNLILKFYP